MKKDLKLIAVILTVAMMWSGCVYYNKCSKTTGCSTLLFYQKSNDSLVAQAFICADSNLYADSTYEQELRTITDPYKSGNFRIESIDTGMHTERSSTRQGKKIPEGFGNCFIPK